MKMMVSNTYAYLTANNYFVLFESIVKYYVFAYVYLNNIGALSVVVGQFN